MDPKSIGPPIFANIRGHSRTFDSKLEVMGGQIVFGGLNLTPKQPLHIN